MDYSQLGSITIVSIDLFMFEFIHFSQVYSKMIGSFLRDVTSSQWVQVVPLGIQMHNTVLCVISPQ